MKINNVIYLILLLLLFNSCETIKIMSPQHRQLRIASTDAKCRLKKQKKVVFVLGVPANEEVFETLFDGVKEPIKVKIEKIPFDSVVESAAGQFAALAGVNLPSPELRTIKVYSCVEKEDNSQDEVSVEKEISVK